MSQFLQIFFATFLLHDGVFKIEPCTTVIRILVRVRPRIVHEYVSKDTTPFCFIRCGHDVAWCYTAPDICIGLAPCAVFISENSK